MFIYFSHELLFSIFFFIVSYAIGIHPSMDRIIRSSHQSKKKLSAHSIKILSWNIGKNKKSNWITEIITLFHKYTPDILILQEVKLEEKIKQVFNDKLLAWQFAPNLVHLKKRFFSGVLTASEVLPNSEDFRHSESREPFTFTPKSTLFTTYPIDGTAKSLLVINIHGINFVSLKHFRAQIHEIIEHGHDHDGPIIFSGDFNTWNKNRIKFLEKILYRKLNLRAVNFDRKHQKKIKKFMFSPPLDHIFYSYKQLKLIKNSSMVLRSYKSSDHKPILAEFQYTGKTTTSITDAKNEELLAIA